MKIDGIKAKTVELTGNLVIVSLQPKDSERDKAKAVYKKLETKCGGAKPNILSDFERSKIPNGMPLIFTADSYTHTIPYYCEIT